MKLSVGMKIGGGLLILLLLLAFIAGRSVMVMNTTMKDTQEVDLRFQRLSMDYQIQNSFQSVAVAIRGYAAYGDSKYLDQYQAQVGHTKKLIEQRIQNSAPETRLKFENLLAQFVSYDQQLSQKMIPLLQENKIQEAASVGAGLAPLTADINESLGQLISQNEGKSSHIIEANISNAAVGRQSVIFFSSAALLLGIILSVVITRSITGPVKVINAGVKSLAAGDFTHTITVRSKDEIGELAQAVNQTREQLKVLISEISDVAQTVAAQSQELAASAEEVNGTAEEVASTTNEVAAMAEKSMDNARVTAAESQRVVEVAESGGATVRQTVEKINAISQSVAEVNHSIQGLGELSKKIGNITNLITGVADQTNLLALNAAIEAARAGEHGRGFAVVAEEVRKLAEQSASAAKEIGGLIGQIQADIENTARLMEQGSADVQEGVALASNAGQALGSIIEAVNNNIQLVDEIAQGSRQTSEGTQQLSASNEQVTSTIQQVTGATQELANIAGKLQTSVSQFKV